MGGTRRGSKVRPTWAALTLALPGLLGLLVATSAFGQVRPPDSPGPIWLEIQATREEMGRVMAIAQRLNARLRDDALLAEIGRAAFEERYDDLADLVADAAGVTPGWVKAGPGEDERRMGRAEPPGIVSPVARFSRVSGGATHVLRSGPWPGEDASPLPRRNPWYLRYQSRSWTWCIAPGVCPSS